jgi:pimeloyl-ACP methyl ester carboxylesterase
VEPILFVHASGLSSREWTRTAERLPAAFEPIVPDLRGYGKSDPVPFGSPISATDDLEALRALLGRPSHLVGHSYGGYLAAKLALEMPDRVASLVLIEPVLFGALRQTGDAEAASELASLYDDPEFLSDSFGGTERWMERFIDYWAGKGSWARLPETHRRANMRVAWKVYREVKDLSNDPAPFEAYAGLPRRTTLVHGTKTTVSARRIIHFLSVVLPEARVRTIEGAGHMSPLTHPEEILAVLREHLSD